MMLCDVFFCAVTSVGMTGIYLCELATVRAIFSRKRRPLRFKGKIEFRDVRFRCE